MHQKKMASQHQTYKTEGEQTKSNQQRNPQSMVQVGEFNKAKRSWDKNNNYVLSEARRGADKTISRHDNGLPLGMVWAN